MNLMETGGYEGLHCQGVGLSLQGVDCAALHFGNEKWRKDSQSANAGCKKRTTDFSFRSS